MGQFAGVDHFATLYPCGHMKGVSKKSHKVTFKTPPFPFYIEGGCDELEWNWFRKSVDLGGGRVSKKAVYRSGFNWDRGRC